MCVVDCHGGAQPQLAVVGDDDRILIAILYVNRAAVEMPAVRLEDVRLGPLLRDGIERQHDSVGPAFHRDADLCPLPRLELPVDEAVSVGHLVLPHEVIRQGNEEVERPRLPLDLVVEIKDAEPSDRLLAAAGFRSQYGRDGSTGGGHPVYGGDVLLEGHPLDVEHAVVYQGAKRVAGDDVLSLDCLQLLNLQELFGSGRLIGRRGWLPAVAGRTAGATCRSVNRQTLQQFARDHDRIDLRFRQPVQQQRLPLHPEGGFLLLLLVFAFQQRLAGDQAVVCRLFQPLDLAADNAQLLDRSQELGLGLQQILVSQPHFEQRLAGPHRFALDGINVRDHARHRGGHFDDRPAGPLDHHSRHAHGSLERPELYRRSSR